MEPQAPPVAATAARRIALQMLEERGRGAVLMGVARVDAALELLLQAVMPSPTPPNQPPSRIQPTAPAWRRCTWRLAPIPSGHPWKPFSPPSPLPPAAPWSQPCAITFC